MSTFSKPLSFNEDTTNKMKDQAMILSPATFVARTSSLEETTTCSNLFDGALELLKYFDLNSHHTTKPEAIPNTTMRLE